MLDFLRQVAVGFWATMVEMSPYLLFGFFMAGLLSVLISRRLVERHLGGPGLLPVLKGSLFGVPMPLCSCGVIPVSMSLYQHGASKGSTIAFLLSTPQTGADCILVMYSLLGPVFAFFAPVWTLVTGLTGGVLVTLFSRKDEVHPEAARCTHGCCKTAETADDCCKSVPGPARKLVDGLKYGFISLPRDIGRSLLVGLVIAAVISALVPDDFFAETLGQGLPAMLLMMLVGIPIYVCASASVPVAAALILKGLSPGAAFVFLATGPATNAAALVTIWNTLGRRTALLYLLTVAGCALAGGLLLDTLVSHIDVAAGFHAHQMGPSLLQHLSAIVLLAVLGYALLRPKPH